MRRFTRIPLASVVVVGIGALVSGAAPQQTSAAARPGELGIGWVGETTAVRARAPREAAAELATLVARETRRHVVVQFARPLSESEKSAVGAAGLRLLAPLGQNAWFASAGAATLDAGALERLPLAAALAPQRAWKLHPMLERGEVPTWTIVEDKAGEPTVGTYVMFHGDVPLEEQSEVALRHGARVRDVVESVNGLVLELPFEALRGLAEEDAVQYVEPALPRMDGVALNDSNRAITGVDTVQSTYGLDGSGVNVMVYDGGTALSSHVDFGGRLTVRDSSGLSGHATHVSGTIGGSGSASGGVSRGMAPGVTIQSYGFQYDGTGTFLYTNPGDFEADYAAAIASFGVDVSNNSIGTNTEPNGFDCSFQGDYGLMSNLIDAAVRGSLSGGVPYRIVWAAGNERQGSRCDVEGFGDYYSTAPPAGAKNHLSIGALNSNDDSMTSFSSWGPTDDGRLKPDFSAPGCQSNGDSGVTSCYSTSNTSYAALCGTSMASPTVTGIVALMLEDYRALYGGPDPRNSTLKALLAHTAVDVLDVGPDFRSGYGSVRATAAIDQLRSGSFAERELGQGDTLFFTVYVTPADSELEVTIAWDDFPSAPNVLGALVNDLDLHVFSPSGVEHFPWTLDPLNPSAPAVRTGRDRKNNIEQVRVSGPEVGGWRVEIRGFNVPSGPQSVSITASPVLLECGSQGLVTVGSPAFQCEDTASVRVVDCDLNTDDGVIDSVVVSVSSDSEPAGEALTLIETGSATSVFAASLTLSSANAPGVLWVADGDTVTASYLDADDGNGNTNVTRTSSAPVDCASPTITNVAVTNITATSATVTFSTNESARGRVDHGLSCGSLAESVEGGLQTSHTLQLTGLADGTQYRFNVRATDPAGNVTLEDAGGVCFVFTTDEVPDSFTEEFAAFDLGGRRILYRPTNTPEGYEACTMVSGGFTVPTAGGIVLPLTDDDAELVLVDNGNTVKFFGTEYDRFYVGSNGYITFVSSDTDYTESLDDHFRLRRISANFDDYNPAAGGQVLVHRLADRIAITWNGVVEFGTSNPNFFQVELFHDGRIRVTYLGMTSTDGVAGLSRGQGIPVPFLESDLSEYECEPRSFTQPSTGTVGDGGTRSL